jgi:hypothetical protein
LSFVRYRQRLSRPRGGRWHVRGNAGNGARSMRHSARSDRLGERDPGVPQGAERHLHVGLRRDATADAVPLRRDRRWSVHLAGTLPPTGPLLPVYQCELGRPLLRSARTSRFRRSAPARRTRSRSARGLSAAAALNEGRVRAPSGC